MKIRKTMEELLKINGFIQDISSGEWVRDNWNIRIINDEMEVYENVEGIGKYLHSKFSMETLESVLEEI